MLTVVCWKWKKPNYHTQFTAYHVNVLARMIKRFYSKPVRIVCITDDPEGIYECETYPLWDDCSRLVNACGSHLPNCYRRLKIFSKEMEKIFGDRIISIDLDVVITGELDSVFDREESFIGWCQPTELHKKALNGSLFSFKTGVFDYIWDWFDPNGSPEFAFDCGWRGSDQAWMGLCLGHRAEYYTQKDGIYSWRTELRLKSGDLPKNAKIVSFNGKQNPWDEDLQSRFPWIKKYYR